MAYPEEGNRLFRTNFDILDGNAAQANLDFVDFTTLNCAFLMRELGIIDALIARGVRANDDTGRIAILTDDPTIIARYFAISQSDERHLADYLPHCSPDTQKLVQEYIANRAAYTKAIAESLPAKGPAVSPR